MLPVPIHFHPGPPPPGFFAHRLLQRSLRAPFCVCLRARKYAACGDPQSGVEVTARPAAQSTRMEHKRRFMAFTTEGFITCRAEAAFNAIEIEFADVHTNRPVRFNDYSGFTMAAMGSAAAIFASPGDGKPAGENSSVVHYRAFSSWAPNADWTLSLPAGEQAAEPRCDAGRFW
jgi:hypothetical protein